MLNALTLVADTLCCQIFGNSLINGLSRTELPLPPRRAFSIVVPEVMILLNVYVHALSV